MNSGLMAGRTRYLKEGLESVSEMCKVIEDARKESLMEVAIRMLEARKYALEENAIILVFLLLK